MKKKLISNGLWFDRQAEEAARFYTSVFPNSKMRDIVKYGNEGTEIHGGKPGNVMVSEFELCGETFVGINGGPIFKFNPSISYFVVLENMEEADRLWNELLKDGSIMMPYQKYDWSEKYGWLQDRYGLSWQISFGKISDVGQQVAPSLLFVGEQCGRAHEAITFYTSIFKDSQIDGIMKHTPGSGEPEGNIAHAQFSLAGQKFMIMESASKEHNFHFNEANSIIINCESQEEIDFYWERLLTDGGKQSQCGWLKDKFGVSWQVDSVDLARMLKSTDKQKVDRVTKEFLKMKKLDVIKLKEVFEGKVPAY